MNECEKCGMTVCECDSYDEFDGTDDFDEEEDDDDDYGYKDYDC